MASQPVIPLEPHELDTRPAHCPLCCAWTAVSTRVAVVDGRDLMVLRTYESVTCPCGYDEVTR